MQVYAENVSPPNLFLARVTAKLNPFLFLSTELLSSNFVQNSYIYFLPYPHYGL